MKAGPAPDRRRKDATGALRAVTAVSGLGMLLAGCATQPLHTASLHGSRYDPRLGVSSSEKVIADGDPVPRGGGGYLTGRPYMVAGRSYVPQQRAEGYSAVGTASWYGDAFHGRRTANGEIFDKGSISAAHPTLPLPSYVRVTNLVNGRSMIVRVNDRGPYHGGRVMDVSQRVAESLDFRRAGTARIRVDFVGRAGLDGSDDSTLLATLRTDGGAAQLAGFGGGDAAGTAAVASAGRPAAPPEPAPSPQPSRVARILRDEGDAMLPSPYGKSVDAPLPPSRPFNFGEAAPAGTEARSPRRSHWRDRLAETSGRQG